MGSDEKAVDRPDGFSERAWSNIETVLPKIAAAVEERSKLDNPSIDLSTAENWLIRPELTKICMEAVSKNLKSSDFSYPAGLAGSPELVNALAGFFNRFFHPHVPVESSHLVTAPGASGCLDAILYHVCDPGDGILMPAPYWSGFDFQFKARVSAVPVPVVMSPVTDIMTEALLPALELAYETSTIPIKGLLICSPQNPLGQCYSRTVIEGCMKFCQSKRIHYISDEVYALTNFPISDLENPLPFISALSIDLSAIGVEGKRVHTFWSTSKDFGQSGIRAGCIITQFNKEMAIGLSMVSYPQLSMLASVFVTSLLRSPDLDQLIKVNSERLAFNYASLTRVLAKNNIDYVPSYAGLYLFARICRPGKGVNLTWDDEANAIKRAHDAGVLLSAGKSYHTDRKDCGWARIGFGLEIAKMREACVRLDNFFSSY